MPEVFHTTQSREKAMPAQTIDELRAFHQFLGAKLNEKSIEWSPEEALDEWRRQHPDAQSTAQDLAAIEEALADVARGDRGIPFDEFDRDFRNRHQLPGLS
jgi:hypothetical protein